MKPLLARLSIVGLALLVSLTVAYTLSWASDGPGDGGDSTPMVLVSTAKKIALFDELSYPARVIPLINANVLAESDGVVSRIAAPLGQKVRRGQTLMTIRHTDPVYQYAPLVVTAPVAGVVSQVDVTEGSLVAKGEKLAAVTDPAKIRISVEIAAADLSQIQPGLVGELRLPGRDAPSAVKVRGVSPFVDPATGTATAELECTNCSGKNSMSPGLVGQVRFKVNEHSGITFPEHAVVYRDGKTFLRVVAADHAKYVEVQLGPTSRGNIEILKGVDTGAKVIERASSFIGEGEAVKTEEAGS